tara:strand:- start:9375 stop:9920 length:546 start_codon:yes stop_codon:yes gene_type:complete
MSVVRVYSLTDIFSKSYSSLVTDEKNITICGHGLYWDNSRRTMTPHPFIHGVPGPQEEAFEVEEMIPLIEISPNEVQQQGRLEYSPRSFSKGRSLSAQYNLEYLRVDKIDSLSLEEWREFLAEYVASLPTSNMWTEDIKPEMRTLEGLENNLKRNYWTPYSLAKTLKDKFCPPDSSISLTL